MRRFRPFASAAGIVAVCLLCGCSKSPGHLPAPDAAALPPAPTAVPEKAAPTKKSSAKAVPVARPASQPPTEAEMTAAKSAGEELKTEEPEENPYSETVTLKVSVSPQVKAQVLWGAKTMAKLAPGSMEAEIVRPRGSGPVDLEIKAEGFLPYHTRLYSDRNEKVAVRLYRAEEAPGLFGYKRAASASETK